MNQQQDKDERRDAGIEDDVMDIDHERKNIATNFGSKLQDQVKLPE